MVRQLLTYKSDVPKKKKIKQWTFVLLCINPTNAISRLSKSFCYTFFLGSKSICSPSKGRFAFLCNEAKNNYICTGVSKTRIIKGVWKWNAWSNLRILCLLWLAMNHLICIRIFLFFSGPAAGFICKPIFAFYLRCRVLPAYINKKKIFSRRKLVSWLC